MCISQTVTADTVMTNAECSAWLNHSVPQLHSTKTIDLCQATAGKTVLIVNTASHCGFTGQFSGLEKLYQEYREDGLVIVGFPSNDFKQEAKNEEEAAKVCYQNYGVSFLMTKPIAVRGKDAHPVFQHLAEQTGKPKWNFYKYLVDKEGNVVNWFSSMDSPESKKLIKAIEQTL